MKKEYSTPEVELVSFSTWDVLTASNYTPDPEIGVRSGDDNEDIEF